MKVFLLGLNAINIGPSNVNRSLILNSDSRLDYVKAKNRIIRKVERFFKCFKYKKIIASCGITKGEFVIVRMFHKQMYYVMHGDFRYENEINKEGKGEKELQLFDEELLYSKKIIAVSERHSEWLKARYPQYVNKITFVNNGIRIERRKKVKKEPLSIAVSGGNRIIKNNDVVCEAVSVLREHGFDIKLYVFGHYNSNRDDFAKHKFTIKVGQLDNEEYYAMLDRISLFVIDSELETFGLVAGDAINCNCSLLVSELVGARSIMKMTDDDIIYNPHDIDEISTKILKLFETPNNDRLFKTIDVENVSERRAYEHLMNVVFNE